MPHPRALILLVVGCGLLPAMESAGPGHDYGPVAFRSSKTFNSERKLKTIFLGKIAFENTRLENALQILSSESRKADPENVGVSFILPSRTKLRSSHAITLSMNHILLNDAIRYTLQLADSNLRYHVEDDRIHLEYAPPEKPISKKFLVANSFFHFEAAANDEEKSSEAKRQLLQMGVSFSTGTSVGYISPTMTLIVVNSPDQLMLIEEILADGTRGIQTKNSPHFAPMNYQ